MKSCRSASIFVAFGAAALVAAVLQIVVLRRAASTQAVPAAPDAAVRSRGEVREEVRS
ncbi:hypothetical protein [Brevibacterium yomogidense]|uniref:Uncharacterized protein n=1 Tax=Brevibacterium yomogidense TaxID=946573 RepID=A0A1X6WZA4_9MICO|nr:hypothetical protein [Brevibacterium yomogidense]SLM91288.1 hypothetical protein FM105_02570 [Brevibacterium yomogidense]